MILLVVATLSACTEENGEDTTPTPVAPTCTVNSISQLNDGSPWNVTLTYNTQGALTKLVDPDGTISFNYENGKLKSMGYDGVLIGEFSYGSGPYPNKFTVSEDGYTFYMELTYEGDNIVRINYHDVTDGVDLLESYTILEYNSAGNVTSVSNNYYDEDTKSYYESTTTGITTDNKKNPYATNFTLKFYELLDGDEINVGTNNPVTARYNYNGTGIDVINTYTYNEEGYPTKRVETGFSSETTYNYNYNCK